MENSSQQYRDSLAAKLKTERSSGKSDRAKKILEEQQETILYRDAKTDRQKGLKEKEINAQKKDLEMLNKKIQKSEGVTTLSESDFMSEKGKKRFNELKSMSGSGDKPTHFNQDELQTIGDELENSLRGNRQIDKIPKKKIEEDRTEDKQNTETKEEKKDKTYEDEEKEVEDDAKQKAIEALKGQKATFVNIDELVEAEARKAADAYMTESKKSMKGFSGFFKKMWKHTFFDEYYRQREVNRVRDEIKNTDNIYVRRTNGGMDAHQKAMGAISERFTSEYEGMLSQGEHKEIINDKDPETKKFLDDIKTAINNYAQGSLDEQSFQEEKVRILNSLGNKDISGKTNYTDNLFEIAQNAKLAIEHGAKLEELDFDTNVIIGKAKSSLKTEAHFNKVDKLIDKMKKSKIGRFISPAVLNTSIGLTYSISVGLGAKFLRSKAAAYGTLGASVAISAAFAGMNESQRLALERAQHGLERAEGEEFEPESKRREEMERYQYQMENSKDLEGNLRNLIFEIDNNGNEKIKNIKEEDLEGIFSTLGNIEARKSLNARNRIDLISYSNFSNVEKDRTDLDILIAKSKVELRKKIEGGLGGAMLAGKSFDEYLSEQTTIIENSLLGGDEGVTAQDKAFRKYKAKRIAKKMLSTAVVGFTVGATVQEGVAFFKDDVDGLVEGWIKGDTGAGIQTPLDHLKDWMLGHSAYMGLDHAMNTELNGHTFNLPEGSSLLNNPDGTYDVLRGDQSIFHGQLNFTNGELDNESIERLGEEGIIANNSHNVINGTKEVIENAKDYLNHNPSGSHGVARDMWYDNDTPKPVFDQNELKLWWGGEGNTGIDQNGNYTFNISHMTSGGSFHNEFSVDAQDKIKEGGLKIILSLTQGTQHQVFDVPIDIHGNAVIDPNSEIGKLFFSVENGHTVFKGRFAEVVESFGNKDGVEHVKTLATLVGNGNDAIHDIVPTHIDNPITNLDIPKGVEPPYYIPFFVRSPLEKAKERGGIYDEETYLDRNSIYEDVSSYDEQPLNVYYENENGYFDENKIDNQDNINTNENKLDKEKIEKYIAEMKKYVSEMVDVKKMEELNSQIGENMDAAAKMTVVLPCYHEGENIYKTLSDWTIKQEDLQPKELEIIVFVNAPKKDEPLDEKTISEINKFKGEHPEYNIKLVKNNFDFKSNRKMGAIYKMPADLAVYRNIKRLESGVPEEVVAKHLLRSGGADALGRNPRFLREIIDFMDKHPETEQLRTQSAYPPDIREKFPLFNLVTVFNHSLSQLYTRGESNIGLGTYRARAYTEAGGFDPSREYREEIDLGTRMRAKIGNNKDAIIKMVKKNAIDNPRRELFALAKGDTILRAYNNFSKPERDQELRQFDWSKKLSKSYEQNTELSKDNITREFDAYFQHYSSKISKESGIISQIINGGINERNLNSKSINPETRIILNSPECISLIKEISKTKESGKDISRSSPEIVKLSDILTQKLFDRILHLTFGFKDGEAADYIYKKGTDGKTHLIFTEKAVTKVHEMSDKKWKNFNGYWGKNESHKNKEIVESGEIKK